MVTCGTWNGDILLAKWEMDYMVHARLSYMILHDTLLCVQGRVLSGVHLAWLMRYLLLLVSFAFVLFPYISLLGFLVCNCCFSCICLCDIATYKAIHYK